jgi:hypothetical protein
MNAPWPCDDPPVNTPGFIPGLPNPQGLWHE